MFPQRTRPERFFGFLLTATLLFATAKCDSTPGVPEGSAKLDSISRDSSQSAARDGSGRPPLTRPPFLLEPEEYVSAELNGSSISLDQNGRIRNGK